MATVIAWSNDYNIGVDEIDQQHQILVGIINKLYSALVDKSNPAIIEEILDELLQYTRMHFAVEECLMRLFDYPDYAEHKATHDRIAERVLMFADQYRAGKHQFGMDLLYFLKDWLTTHINEEDKAYSPHLNRGGKQKWLRPFR